MIQILNQFDSKGLDISAGFCHIATMLSNNEKVKLILLEEFVSAQARNPSFSMRAFSKKIGISQAAISEVFSGKRPMTQKSALKALKGLGKSPLEISELFDSELGVKSAFKPIDLDSFHLISDWYYYAILSLAETDNFDSSPKSIAERLGITIHTVNEAIDRLVRLGLLIRETRTNQLKVTGEQFEALSEIANLALKKACRQNLELAQKALEESQFEERDFTAITICFDPNKMIEAKKLIKAFRRNFCRLMEAGKKKEVYKLSIQLFPLTIRSKK